jgi:hypothetical protein
MQMNVNLTASVDLSPFMKWSIKSSDFEIALRYLEGKKFIKTWSLSSSGRQLDCTITSTGIDRIEAFHEIIAGYTFKDADRDTEDM